MTSIAVSLSPAILTLLCGKGLTSARAGELLGVGPRQAARLLTKAGAVRDSNNGMWHMPSVARLIEANRRWNNPATATGNFEFTERSGRKADKKSGHANRTAGRVDG
jgi:hypothetical protein